MSETMTRELSGAARRTASSSVTWLKAAAGFVKPHDGAPPEPANETDGDTAQARPDPSVISANTQMSGSITTSDALHIHGAIDGNVRAAEITVCAGGKIKGDLNAETIIIHGAVEGRIEAQHVLLRTGAVVNGDIVHGSLGIDTAAVFEGTIKRMTAKIVAD